MPFLAAAAFTSGERERVSRIAWCNRLVRTDSSRAMPIIRTYSPHTALQSPSCFV